MSKTLEEWLEEFEGILLCGFFFQGDASTKFRKMELEVDKLKKLLKAFILDLREQKPNDPQRPESPGNAPKPAL